MFIFGLLSLGSLSLDCSCLFVSLSGKKLWKNWKFRFKFEHILNKLFHRHFDTFKIKISSISDLEKFSIGVVHYGGTWVPNLFFIYLVYFLKYHYVIFSWKIQLWKNIFEKTPWPINFLFKANSEVYNKPTNPQNSFNKLRGNNYIPFLLLIITPRFSFVRRKVWWNS